MLKGLDGVTTHEHREWIPILDNDQDMTRLGARVRALLPTPACHAFLLRRHGMYTWGTTLADAVRHVEILEFLLEAVGRSGEATARRSATAPLHVFAAIEEESLSHGHREDTGHQHHAS